MAFDFRLKIKPLIFIASLIPLVWLILKAFTSGLGANPVEKIQHLTGDWALNFLLITLAVSPFKNIPGLTWLGGIRRMMGLFSFFYASLHFINYVAIDQFFSLTSILEDVSKHKRIIVGFISFILLLILAVTSTNRMLQRLGFKRWKALHRLTYITATGGVIHYLWLVKKDMRRPLFYACILLVLLGYRGVLYSLNRISKVNRQE